MSSQYKPYPAYKDSGVEWIGEIPEHWTIKPVYSIASLRNGFPFKSELFKSEGIAANRVLRIRDLVSDEGAIYSKEECPKWAKVANGDILIGMDGDFNIHQWGRGDAKLNQRMCSISGHTEEISCLLNRSLVAPLKVINDLAYTTTVKHLSSYEVLHTKVALPPKDEAQHINKALDTETTHIDTLIQKKTRFIELLKEKRQALITHAVTKGLDSNMKMKDSGVKWIGEVPEHWCVRRMASLFREVAREGKSDLPILSISIHSGITDEELTPEERDRQTYQIEDKTKYKRVMPNDLAYNMMRAWQGGFGAAKVEGLVSPAYVVAEPTEEFHASYIELLLRTSMAIEEMRRFSRGIADFRMRLYWDYFRDLKICLPPKTEQKEILNYISFESNRIGSLIHKTEKSIDLLKERRSALITAAVTGKIDLRDSHE